MKNPRFSRSDLIRNPYKYSLNLLHTYLIIRLSLIKVYNQYSKQNINSKHKVICILNFITHFCHKPRGKSDTHLNFIYDYYFHSYHLQRQCTGWSFISERPKKSGIMDRLDNNMDILWISKIHTYKRSRAPFRPKKFFFIQSSEYIIVYVLFNPDFQPNLIKSGAVICPR